MNKQIQPWKNLFSSCVLIKKNLCLKQKILITRQRVNFIFTPSAPGDKSKGFEAPARSLSSVVQGKTNSSSACACPLPRENPSKKTISIRRRLGLWHYCLTESFALPPSRYPSLPIAKARQSEALKFAQNPSSVQPAAEKRGRPGAGGSATTMA